MSVSAILVSRKELNKNNTYRGKKGAGTYSNKRWNEQCQATGFNEKQGCMMNQG